MRQSPHPHTIVIFGASGGIDSAEAKQLAAQGCHLSLVARDPASWDARSTAAELCPAQAAETCGSVDPSAVRENSRKVEINA